MMGDYNLEIKKGITARLVCTYKDPAGNPINLTGFDVRAQGRASIESADPVFSLDTATGILVAPLAGEITLLWPASASVNYDLVSNGVWSLEIEAGGEVTELLTGALDIIERPTRE